MNYNKSFKSGFTLIELLVVVAIIGILASIVLASLNTARAKGVDAAVKGTIANARAQAGLFYDDNGNDYTGVCTVAGGISPMVQSAAEKLGVVPAAVGINTDDFVYDADGAVTAANSAPSVCHDSVTAWAAIVSLKLPSTPSSGWCADSTGASREATSLLANATACP